MKLLITLVAVTSLVQPCLAADPLTVQDAWVRATVPGQMATGAYMRITAADNAKLLGVNTPLALASIHQMSMSQGVMKMAAVQGGLDLPAGTAVELKPGGYHVMLMDLKQPFTAGASVPLTLVYRDAKGREQRLTITASVGMSGPKTTGQAMPQAMHANPHGSAVKH
jgi:copper(I)-binding protein